MSAEEWAFRYQQVAGAIEATGSLIDLFVPENQYCEYPMRPSQQDDLALLDGWNNRLSQLDRDAVDLENDMGDPDEGLRDASAFEGLTGVPPEPHVFQSLRRRAREFQARIPERKAAVKARPVVKCVRSHEPQTPPEPTPPPAPPADPAAGLTPPELLPFTPPTVPDPLCTEEQRQAALREIAKQRYNADENAVRVSHFRHDISLALLDGRGDAAALREMHDQADRDLADWDAKSAETSALWSRVRKQPLDDCEKGDAPPPAPAEPAFKYNFGLGADYLYQRLPSKSGEVGVVGVGGPEQPLLRNPRHLDGWKLEFWNSVWNVGPSIHGSKGTLFLGGNYGEADGDRSNAVGGDPGVVNGLTWWREQGGSSGISAPGSNLAGSADLDFRTFELRGGMKWDFPCGDEEWDEEDGPPGRPRLRFTWPTTLVETGLRIHYNEQEVRQNFFMGHNNPGFALFDVRSSNDIETTDWSFLYDVGLQEVMPIRWVPGLLVTAGADVGIGYYRAKADGEQWNSCDIRFAGAPGVNVCSPGSQSFGVSVDPDHSGFDYQVGAGVRISQSLDFLHKGLHIGANYQFDYIGVSRFDSPVNLLRDGTPDVEWKHEPRHEGGLFIGGFF